jgi:drug/metabolite transporter (DMT)-like permease
MKAQRAVGTPDSRYPLGVALLLIAGTCLSFGGLLLRAVEAADGWQILFYRSGAFIATLLCYLCVVYRGRLVRPFLAIGWHGLVAAVALGVGFSCYVFGMLLTTVANLVFLLATGPFFAAGLAWLLLGERVARTTLLAMCAAALGLGLMVADGLAGGRLLGNLVGLGAPITFAILVLVVRGRPQVDMMPATCLGGVVSLLIAGVMVDDLAISSGDLLLCLLLGSVQVGVGFLLITLGARHVPSAEVPLFALTETVLAPIWVWLAIDEVPSLLTLGGGVTVLGAVAVAGLAGMRAQARPALEAGKAGMPPAT